MAPSYVKPYVKRQKNDAADAEAICEAVGRPTMRFVAVKTAEQQSVMVLHRTRLLLMRQRTRLANALRGHMAEYGIVAPSGRGGLQRLLEMIVNESDERVPPLARACLRLLVTQLQLVNAQALETERQIKASARSTEVGRRLMEIPGVGPVLASAIVAAVADPGAFRCDRNLAAWIGLVPRQSSSGGKDRLGGISKQGHRYLRNPVVVPLCRCGSRTGRLPTDVPTADVKSDSGASAAGSRALDWRPRAVAASMARPRCFTILLRAWGICHPCMALAKLSGVPPASDEGRPAFNGGI